MRSAHAQEGVNDDDDDDDDAVIVDVLAHVCVMSGQERLRNGQAG